MEYIAVRPGFRNDRLIPAGGTFEADDFDGSWAVPKTDYESPKPEPEEDLIAKAVEALRGRRVSPEPEKKRGRPKGKRKAPK